MTVARFCLSLLVFCGMVSFCLAADKEPASAPTSAPSSQKTTAANLQISGFVGFSERSGQARAGCFTPVQVELRTQGEPFDGQIILRAPKVNSALASEPMVVFQVRAGINTTKAFSDVFRIEPGIDSLVAELWVKGKKIKETHLGLSLMAADRSVVLVLSDHDAELRQLADLSNPLPDHHRNLVFGQVRSLPRHWRGYDVVDAILIDDVSLLEIDKKQIEALRTWIQAGGQLIVAGGPGWQRVQQSFLAEDLPVRLDDSVSIASPFPANTIRPTSGANVLVVKTTPKEGKLQVLWHDNGSALDLIQRAPYGAGTVTFVAFTLSERQVLSSPWLSDLGSLLFPPLDMPQRQRMTQNEAVEIESRLKNKSLLPLPTADMVGTWMLLYLLIFLPGIFALALVWRGAKIAWIILPIGFVAATLAIVQTGRSQTGQQRTFVQLGVRRHWPDGGYSLGRSYLSMYSGPADRFDIVSLLKDTLPVPLPLPAFPGSKPEAFRASLEALETPALLDFQVPPHSARSLELDDVAESAKPPEMSYARYYRRSTLVNEQRLLWATSDERVEGQITNNTNLDLRDAAILGFTRAIPLGDVKAGQKVPFTIQAGSGVPMDHWLPNSPSPEIARDTSAAVSLARESSMLAVNQLRPFEVALVGWSPNNPLLYQARSNKGLSSIGSSRSTSAMWHIIPLGVMAEAPKGEPMHLEGNDYEAQFWNEKERRFNWRVHRTYMEYEDEAPMNDRWTIRFRPQFGFISKEKPQWPLASAWGSIVDDYKGTVEIYNFTSRKWMPAPASNEGRRVLAKSSGAFSTALVRGDDVVDHASGTMYVRLSGNTYDLTDCSLDIRMNYLLWP